MEDGDNHIFRRLAMGREDGANSDSILQEFQSQVPRWLGFRTPHPWHRDVTYFRMLLEFPVFLL
jgi:hypothetical protein